MIIRTLWITRKGHAPDPELLTAWDEITIDENPDGWREACENALLACGDAIAEHRYINLTVSDAALDAAFRAPYITATVALDKG